LHPFGRESSLHSAADQTYPLAARAPRPLPSPAPLCSIGRNIKALIEPPSGEPHVFRLHADRVFYAPERVMKAAIAFPRDDLVSLGVCFGKFTRSGKFLLKVTCLDLLAEHARYKVWVKPSAEMSFLYGNDIAKSGVARMTEAIPQYAGVIVLSLTNMPLGFGRANYDTDKCKDVDGPATVVLHQADIGEYLRMEDELA